MSGPATAIGDFGQGIGDFFSAEGDQAEGHAYEQAATYSSQNAALEAESTQIQMAGAKRQIFQTVGAQKAQVAGAGLAESGSAGDLLRSSVSQGNIQMQLLHTQGLINENAYKEQAAANTGMAKAADAAGEASEINGAGSILGGIASLF